MLVTAGYSFMHQHTALDVCPHLRSRPKMDQKFYWHIQFNRLSRASLHLEKYAVLWLSWWKTWLNYGPKMRKTLVRQTTVHPHCFDLRRPSWFYQFCMPLLFCLNIPIWFLTSFVFFSSKKSLAQKSCLWCCDKVPELYSAEIGSNFMRVWKAFCGQDIRPCSSWYHERENSRGFLGYRSHPFEIVCDKKTTARAVLRKRIMDIGSVVLNRIYHPSGNE